MSAVEPLAVPPLLTLRQAAEVLGVDERTLFSIRRRGELAVVKFGASVRVSSEALRAFIASREVREGVAGDAPESL